MPPVHIAKFSASHICYQRRPSCALFPVEAYRLKFAFKRAWMVFQRPLDPICIGMDICIMPKGPSTVSTAGTVRDLLICASGWTVFQMHPHRASVRPFLLCVPTAWAALPEGSYGPRQSTLKERLRFCQLSGVPSGVLDIVLKALYLPPSDLLSRHNPSAPPRSSAGTEDTGCTLQVPVIVITPGTSQYV